MTDYPPEDDPSCECSLCDPGSTPSTSKGINEAKKPHRLQGTADNLATDIYVNAKMIQARYYEHLSETSIDDLRRAHLQLGQILQELEK